MRRFTASLLALALLPTVALAAPEGASADKRMLIFRTAIGRDNCPQAREVAESMSKDFPEDGNVKLMLAQVLACEGKWAEAFVPMMAAKTAGVDVTAEEAKILAQVALVDVTVTVDGKESDVALPVVARTGNTSWGGVSLGSGRFVFAVPDGEVGFSLTSDRLPYNGKVAAQTYPMGQRHTVSFELERARTVSLTRPAGLGPSVTVRANGIDLEDTPREIRVEGGPGREVHFVATWKTPQDNEVTAEWDGDAASNRGPWAHIVRDQERRIVDLGLHGPDSPSVDLSVVDVDGESMRITVERGDAWLSEVALEDSKPKATVQVGLEVEMSADAGRRYGWSEFFEDEPVAVVEPAGQFRPTLRVLAQSRIQGMPRLTVGGILRLRMLGVTDSWWATGGEGVLGEYSYFNGEFNGFARWPLATWVSVEGGLAGQVTGLAHANVPADTTPVVEAGATAGVRLTGKRRTLTPTLDVRATKYLASNVGPTLSPYGDLTVEVYDRDNEEFVNETRRGLGDPVGYPSWLEVEGSLRLRSAPVTVRVGLRGTTPLVQSILEETGYTFGLTQLVPVERMTFAPSLLLRAGMDWSF
jgi:hypothetical protein